MGIQFSTIPGAVIVRPWAIYVMASDLQEITLWITIFVFMHYVFMVNSFHAALEFPVSESVAVGGTE